jgi:hypothetical protein
MALFFVVSREYRHVYEELRAAFAESADVVIILDRRFSERRRADGGPPAGAERRRGQRRQPPDDRFASIGWRIVRRPS